MIRGTFLSLTLCAAAAAQPSPLAGRVGNTGFVQLTAESFNQLTPRQQALAYWLSQASIAIDPIKMCIRDSVPADHPRPRQREMQSF